MENYDYTMQYAGEDEAVPIDRAIVEDKLSGWFRDVGAVIDLMHEGLPVRTPFAVFRASRREKFGEVSAH